MTSQQQTMPSTIYLDHNATTPLDPIVFTAMEPYLKTFFGNPSSVEHEHGHIAALAVDRARGQIANTIGARPQEILFTGSCTEANNLAILGTARAQPDKRHIVTTRIEHPAVLEPARALEREGWRVTYLDVDEYGCVSPDTVAAVLTNDTALVSVMAANNEIGTLQPIGAIGALCADRDILFHTDLAQAISGGDINVERNNVHLASLSAHKVYGPKGIGALYVRSRKPRVKLKPIIYGGGQERGLRPGTMNTAAIVGMGEAFHLAGRRGLEDSARLRNLCSQFTDQLFSAVSGVLLNGHPEQRLANNLSFSIDEIEPLALIQRLGDRVSFSASSACTTDKIETSHVLLAVFGDVPRSRGAFRIAPGRFTSEQQMEEALELLISEVRQLRGIARPAA